MFSLNRLAEDDGILETQRVVCALANARTAYSKLRLRASVLKVAKDQGWGVAKELAILHDEEEDPLLKKAMKNAAIK